MGNWRDAYGSPSKVVVTRIEVLRHRLPFEEPDQMVAR